MAHEIDEGILGLWIKSALTQERVCSYKTASSSPLEQCLKP